MTFYIPLKWLLSPLWIVVESVGSRGKKTVGDQRVDGKWCALVVRARKNALRVCTLRHSDFGKSPLHPNEDISRSRSKKPLPLFPFLPKIKIFEDRPTRKHTSQNGELRRLLPRVPANAFADEVARLSVGGGAGIINLDVSLIGRKKVGRRRQRPRGAAGGG